jgi:outer membrane usher protein
MDMLLGLPELRVRPQAETVVSARFDARRTRSALLVVRHSGGDPIAPGARAWHQQDPAGPGAPFAQGGQVYLSDLQDHNRIRIQGPQGVCVLAFDAPPDTTLQPQLGPFTCVPEVL